MMITWIRILTALYLLCFSLEAQGQLDHQTWFQMLKLHQVNTTSFDYKVTDAYTDESTGITYTYVQQLKDGLAIHKATGIIAQKEEQTIVKKSRLLEGATFQKSRTTNFSVAYGHVLKDLGLSSGQKSASFERLSKSTWKTQHRQVQGDIYLERVLYKCHSSRH